MRHHNTNQKAPTTSTTTPSPSPPPSPHPQLRRHCYRPSSRTRWTSLRTSSSLTRSLNTPAPRLRLIPRYTQQLFIRPVPARLAELPFALSHSATISGVGVGIAQLQKVRLVPSLYPTKEALTAFGSPGLTGAHTPVFGIGEKLAGVRTRVESAPCHCW